MDTHVLYLDTGPRSKTCEHQLAALRRSAVTLHPFAERDDLNALAPLFLDADLIVDALLGICSSGTLREPLVTCVRLANGSKAKILAVDIPTPGMKANRVSAFHGAKTDGATVIDIGIPLEAECTAGPGDLTLVPARKRKAHKGAGGEVLVIGGGPYQGAHYLAGLGALRAGADKTFKVNKDRTKAVQKLRDEYAALELPTPTRMLRERTPHGEVEDANDVDVYDDNESVVIQGSEDGRSSTLSFTNAQLKNLLNQGPKKRVAVTIKSVDSDTESIRNTRSVRLKAIGAEYEPAEPSEAERRKKAESQKGKQTAPTRKSSGVS